MRTIQFQMCGRLIFGSGALAELPGAMEKLGAQKALIVTDPGLVKAGVCALIQQTLDEAKISHALFDGVEPDPRIEIVQACADAVRESGADVLIGLGGGSSLDIAKMASVVMTNDGDVLDFVGIGNIPKPGMKKILIPTTSGTGSEVTPIAVLSDKAAHLKKGVVSDYLYPDVALVDPDLTIGLPPAVTAFTGMDAMTHAVEAYTNKNAHPFIDTFALEAVRLIGQYLPRAVADGKDIEARSNMSQASLYGGMCLGPVNTAAVHALAYPLGGTFDVAHGVANSLLLPHVMRFNAPSCPEKYARIAEALGREATADEAVAGIEALSKKAGIVSQMRELNIPRDAIGEMAKAAMQVARLLNNNPRELTEEDAKQIYEAAW
ncbi:MAG: iron-containing alcohol dehydrogenase [Candidatus Sumerlaeota bacterium]